MALISLKQLLDHAAEYNYGIPAFNVSNLEQIQAIMEAANKTNSPVILQASVSAIKYAGSSFIRHLFLAAIEQYYNIPVCIHQDHATSVAYCKRAMQLGFSSVMIDGSLESDGSTPANYNYNVEVTKKVVDIAHAKGVSVEGEIGCLGSLETLQSYKEDGVGASGMLSVNQLLTSPKEAASFVNDTQVDALAVAIGTSHGAYKFSSLPTHETLDLHRIKDISSLIPNVPLVMHGASSLTKDLIYDMNHYGGRLDNAYGVPISDIIKAIEYGVRKINIDTDLRIASTGSIRKFMFNNKHVFDPRQYNNEAKNAMRKVCQIRYEEFRSKGMANKIKPLSLQQMLVNYY